MDDARPYHHEKDIADSIHSVVIGSGFGGIAAALRMRAKGHQVTLIERLGDIGGRARVFERGGFRHDAGPTVITAPFYLMSYLHYLGRGVLIIWNLCRSIPGIGSTSMMGLNLITVRH